MGMKLKNIPIKKSDIPCQQCCNTHETQKQDRYVANRCNEEEMRECPIWQYRDLTVASKSWIELVRDGTLFGGQFKENA